MTITMQLNEQFCLILSLDRLVMYSVLSYTTHWIRHGSTRIRLVQGGIPELSVPARFYCRDPPLFFSYDVRRLAHFKNSWDSSL
jgi:hypothetical protein